jgi:hypothetical protein
MMTVEAGTVRNTQKYLTEFFGVIKSSHALKVDSQACRTPKADASR